MGEHERIRDGDTVNECHERIPAGLKVKISMERGLLSKGESTEFFTTS